MSATRARRIKPRERRIRQSHARAGSGLQLSRLTQALGRARPADGRMAEEGPSPTAHVRYRLLGGGATVAELAALRHASYSVRVILPSLLLSHSAK